MPTPEKTPATTSRCRRCRIAEPVLGSQCVECYVYRRSWHLSAHALYWRPLRSRLWFRLHEDRFVAALKGRVMAIKEGLEPGPAEELVRLFHGHIHPHEGGSADKHIRNIIEGADALARGIRLWRRPASQ